MNSARCQELPTASIYCTPGQQYACSTTAHTVPNLHAGVAFQVQINRGEPGTLVRAVARFPPASPRTAAEALVTRLTTPGALWAILPRTAWDAQLVYATFPIQVCVCGRAEA